MQAPLERIDAIVERNPILQKLFGNDWISVVARAAPDQPWQRWTLSGWRPWTDTPNTAQVDPTHNKELIP